ncbi:MAG: GGDEF domain-containing protein [Xanthomonadales bacterium]|nr:GGDEF domain-containing protein [Xanthomonadales bacterium]
MDRDLEALGTDLRRIAQEVGETRRRMVIGGSFYVLGWVLVCLFTPVVRTYPATSAVLAAIFVGLAVARVVLRPPQARTAETMVRWLDLQWIIIQVSAATWGGIVLWTLMDPVLVDARIALIIGAAGFATAIANTYCMRFWPSLLAITAIYLPSTMYTWMPGQDRAVAFSLSVYLLYVISSLVRSHRDFHSRLDFDEELRRQYEAQAAARADAFRIGLGAVAVVPELADLRVRVSIGVGAFSASRHGNADHFLSEVDGALYRAKGGGRDRVCRASLAPSVLVGEILGQHR